MVELSEAGIAVYLPDGRGLVLTFDAELRKADAIRVPEP